MELEPGARKQEARIKKQESREERKEKSKSLDYQTRMQDKRIKNYSCIRGSKRKQESRNKRREKREERRDMYVKD
ncbi:hypothetical protein FHG64_15490 [Antarcticibacterium flavum]|uniref:Uncharacterized protein n=1 Tax=Antarcticibacterium flavum TaxID=2058175 RepID=A0A5B7X7S7_9FLAO|nr:MULTISPECIES: hypothetical protein [Antarcticibacterium]MCM4159748.1 hypothetical protein [Antarcticibacterium sp. W02-3]QCY70681.1 hypothetical protein FHG64_15490 [Antarcticibacterium flavum]